MKDRSFLELPRDMHLQVFSFLHKQDVVRMGRVCKALHQATKDNNSPFARLSYESLDYSQFIKMRKPTFHAFHGRFEEDVLKLVPLSKTKIASLMLALPKKKARIDVDEVTLSILHIDFQSNIHETICAQGDYYVIGGMDDYLLAGKRTRQDKLDIEVWDVSDVQKPCKIREIKNDFSIEIDKIFSLSKNIFILHDSQGFAIFDLTKPENNEMIYTDRHPHWVPDLFEKQFVRLTDTQFMVDRNQPNLPRALEVYDVTQPEGQQIIRQIKIETNSKYLTVLSNGYIAYLSDRTRNASNGRFEKSAVYVWLLDLYRSPGEERVKEIKIISREEMLEEDLAKTVKQLLALPNDCFAIVFSSSRFMILDVSLPTKPTMVLDNARSAELMDAESEEGNGLEDNLEMVTTEAGQILFYSLKGGFYLSEFARAKLELESKPEPEPELEPESEEKWGCRLM